MRKHEKELSELNNLVEVWDTIQCFLVATAKTAFRIERNQKRIGEILTATTNTHDLKKRAFKDAIEISLSIAFIALQTTARNMKLFSYAESIGEFSQSLSAHRSKSPERSEIADRLEFDLLTLAKSLLSGLYDALFSYQMLDAAQSSFLDDPLFTKPNAKKWLKIIAASASELPGRGILVEIYKQTLRRNKFFKDKLTSAQSESERFAAFIEELNRIQREFLESEVAFEEAVISCRAKKESCQSLSHQLTQ